MTAVETNPTTAEEVHAASEKLAPTLAGRAAEIERARRLPADLLEDLIAAGCFRLLVPREYGGVEADLPSALRALEVLSRADGSVGWTVMIGAGGA